MTQTIELLRERADEFIAVRRDIHSHPELPFTEHRTSEIVARKLESWGYTVRRGLGGTGVVGQLKRGTSDKCLGIRADMDALPIIEASGQPWASKTKGIMHACGHDGHTAMLLAAARHLAESSRFDGTLNLIFQPAEEGAGGAQAMIADGLFKEFPCDAIFAMHNMPGIPQGHLAFCTGAAMASSDFATITLQGRGGHGAIPQKAADPVVAAASIVMALQTIVARNVPPLEMAVVTVGAIHAGVANNVIPDQAVLELCMRTLNADVRALLEKRIKAIAVAQAESFGVKANVEWRKGYTVLVNTPEETEFARSIGLELVGEDHMVRQAPPQTGSEDFAFMLEEVPGSYLLIGNGEGEGVHGCMVHNPGYDFNDANIAVGSAYWVKLAERFLSV